MPKYTPSKMHHLERAAPLFTQVLRGVCMRCQLGPSRAFHTTRYVAAQPAPKTKLNMRTQARKQLASSQTLTSYDVEDCLPPIVLLNSAKKSGAFDLEPEKALTFLRKYHSHAQKPTPGWEQRLCTEQDIRPSHVAFLAGILRRCRTPAQRSLAKSLMHSASELGDKSATFEIVSTALRAGVIDRYQASLRRLAILARKDGNPQAMMLLGKVLFAQSREKEAFDWLSKATTPPTGNLEFDGAGEALMIQGRILSKLGETEDAKALLEQAAKELDDPLAYFYLSQLEEPNSANQQVYLLKAASMGISDAWHNLGSIELAKLQNDNFHPKRLEDYGMAYEWFNVAATAGFGLSMLNLATMLRSVGRTEEALDWLVKADVHGVAQEARRMREWLEDQEVEKDDEETNS